MDLLKKTKFTVPEFKILGHFGFSDLFIQSFYLLNDYYEPQATHRCFQIIRG